MRDEMTERQVYALRECIIDALIDSRQPFPQLLHRQRDEYATKPRTDSGVF
jgi:hypothetical protein